MMHKQYTTECGQFMVEVDSLGRARAFAVAHPAILSSWHRDLCWEINHEENNLHEAVEILGEAGHVLHTQQEDVR